LLRLDKLDELKDPSEIMLASILGRQLTELIKVAFFLAIDD